MCLLKQTLEILHTTGLIVLTTASLLKLTHSYVNYHGSSLTECACYCILVKIGSTSVSNTYHLTVHAPHYLAMHPEHKVVRLEREVLQVNYTYLLDQMVPEMVVPQLVARRLLTLEKVKEVMEKSDWNQKLTTILDAVLAQRVVGTLPTLCAALRDTLGQEKCAKKLDTCEYVCVSFFLK